MCCANIKTSLQLNILSLRKEKTMATKKKAAKKAAKKATKKAAKKGAKKATKKAAKKKK